MKIGVVGNGFVGHAMTLLRPHIEVLVWDVVPEKRDPKTLDIEKIDEQQNSTSCNIFVKHEHLPQIRKRSNKQ